ncbi:MAG: hypothetical protein HGA30_01375, partial [Anaerolineales bacterium]|nr:hypothetical protein [Anaerolineales bacterium]
MNYLIIALANPKLSDQRTIRLEDYMTTLIECIPNFSEARRPEVIDQIVAA